MSESINMKWNSIFKFLEFDRYISFYLYRGRFFRTNIALRSEMNDL